MQLRHFQHAVLDAIQGGRNVILQAPTGSGKTLAALLPFFQALDRAWGKPNAEDAILPLTCRYAVPMRVLANQFHREYRDWFQKLDQKRGTDFERTYQEKLGISVPALQTGETAADPLFESPLTFCTIDQLLASVLSVPYSVGKRQANLNVAAVAGSYLILDEFHLYPLDHQQGARMTTLALLRLLRGVSRFVLMTATFSTHLLRELGQLLDAEVITITDDAELAEIMTGRQRTIQMLDAPLDATTILTAQRELREREGRAATLVVCNTVARAQAMYGELRAALSNSAHAPTRLMLLHSRYTSGDRAWKSQLLEDWLGAGQWQDGQYLGEDTIVVGTQVVEVGLNISAHQLFTEIAPANSLIQRAGRCARFARQQGHVFVAPLPLTAEGQPGSPLPYDRHICDLTQANLPIDQQPFGFREEQTLIDAVHTAEDRRMLETFQQSELQIQDAIQEVLTTHDTGRNGELIRDVRAVTVVIHPEPQTAITTRPYEWEGFSMQPGTLIGAWDALDRRADVLNLDWRIRSLVDAGVDEESDNSREPHYSWAIVQKAQLSSLTRVALPPDLAAYDADVGFRLLLDLDAPSGTYVSQQIKRDSPHAYMPRRQASYVTHISGLMAAYRYSVRQDMAWLFARLEDRLGYQRGSIDQAIRLAIACHDIGKLSRGWQRWARDWQDLLIREEGMGYAIKAGNAWLAKTDGVDPYAHEMELKRQLVPSRPPHHAGESAIASAQAIGMRVLTGKEPQDAGRYFALVSATISAIARHHSPLTASFEAVQWNAEARTAIAAALQACDLDPAIATTIDLTARQPGLINPEYLATPLLRAEQGAEQTWLAYAIVRALRLCDQRAERGL